MNSFEIFGIIVVALITIFFLYFVLTVIRKVEEA